MRLTENFFNRNTVTVAKDLLGKYLVHQIGRKKVARMITETEAYRGPQDKACHASKGRTKRTEVLFGRPGSIYVYLIYGMYHCLNFVTEKENYPAAVLIRGLENINGPGKVCRELKIDRSLNALPADNKKLWVEDRGVVIKKSQIKASKRIGVDYAGSWADKLWRFTIK